jgi:hypothetical protein
MTLHVAAMAKLTLNVLINGGAVSCFFLWLFGVQPAPALVLLGWMVYCSYLHISQSIRVGWADICKLGYS